MITKRPRPHASYQDPDEPIFKRFSGLMVDEAGVPYVDQSMHLVRKSKVRKRTPEQRRLIQKRIEQVRSMLAMQLSPSDIKRACAERWGMKPRSISAYLSVARKQNNELLGRSPEEFRADSQFFWSRQLLEYQVQFDQARALMSEGQEAIRLAQSTLQSAREFIADASSLDERARAVQSLETGITAMEAAMRVVGKAIDLQHKARRRQHRIMNRLDRMVAQNRTKYEP